jgi:hypothetical protein
MAEIKIDTTKITDWNSFHQVFKDALGFPDFYGKNMDASIDCLSSLDEDIGLCDVELLEDEMLHLHITNTSDFKRRQPDLLDALIECSAFVNFRYTETKDRPRVSLVFLDCL